MSLEWILSQVQRHEWRMRGVGWFVAGTGFGQLAMAWLASTEFTAEIAKALRLESLKIAATAAGVAHALVELRRVAAPRLRDR